MERKLTRDQISPNAFEKKVVEVPMEMISSIDINPRKNGLIMENIENLIATHGEFPEIYLGLLEGKLIIIDGWHRFTANQRLELPTINAFIVEFNSLEEMKLEAFKLNVNHGIKLSDLDIALNIYDFYLDAISKNTTTTLKSVIESCGLKERRGRMLFYYTMIHKEILDTTPTEIVNVSIYEEYTKIINKSGEVIGNFSEEFKRKFKNFLERYGNLNRTELRLAINNFIEGKDYYEEKEKEEKLFAEMMKKDAEEKKDNVEVISNEDLIDRNGITKTSVSNPIIEELDEIHNSYEPEVVTEEKNEEKPIEKNTPPIAEPVIAKDPINNGEEKVSLDCYFDAIKENFRKIKLYAMKGKGEITKQNYTDLNLLVDVIDELIVEYGEK